MHLLTRQELRSLITPPGGLCVSLYMPTHRAGAETQQDPIRLKNLLRAAEDRLMEQGLRRDETRRLLAPVHSLFDDLHFWRHQSDGLAIFVAPERFHAFQLPIQFNEIVQAGDRFHIKPLLRLFRGDGRFSILALSQKSVRYLQGTRFSVGEIPVENLPKNIADVLRADQFERHLQFRTVAPTGAGRRTAMFHGHGGPDEDLKENLRQYFRKINDALRDVLREERSPLVLASVDYLQAIYREVNTYPHLMIDGITGNPDALRPDELHRAGWKIVEPYFNSEIEKGVRQYHQLAGTGMTANTIREILPAAFHGRIELLYAASGKQIWGRYTLDTNEIEVHDDRAGTGEDLLDTAVIQTILHGGTAYVVPPDSVPGGGDVAALYRF